MSERALTIDENGVEIVHHHDRGLLAIAILKFVKAGLLILLGIGALALLHKDVAATVTEWVRHIRVDPDNQYVRSFLGKLGLVDDKRLKQVGTGTFFYAALLLIEGTGLLLEKSWAEYLTIIITSSFIPLEVYEVFHHFSLLRTGTLLLNVFIVAYLVYVVRRNRARRHAAAQSVR